MRTKKELNKQTPKMKKGEISKCLSITTLNVDGLNTLIKSCWLTECINFLKMQFFALCKKLALLRQID
jgi:hypothetical protein